MHPQVRNRSPEFTFVLFFFLSLALAISGCGSTSSTPPPDTTPPSAPAGLTATAVSTSQIDLSWTASTDNVAVAGYKVERCSVASCSNFIQIATPTATTFNDTGLTSSTSYSYRVRATDAAANLSNFSATSTASTLTPDTTPPTAPANLTATATSATQINLSWTASTDNVGVTGYRVERCSGVACSNFAEISAPSSTTFNDSGLAGSTSYSYRVRATDAAGNLGSYSGTASAITPASPVVVSISPKRAGVTTMQPQQFTPTVTGSSNTSVTWEVDTVPIGNSTVGTIDATGKYTPPATAGVHTVTARSVADTTKTASATIGVTDLSGVTTYHNDLSRAGVNTREFALTTANVTTGTFAKLFACPIDAPAYAQPLWIANLPINGGTHNVVFAATVRDSVYAFDADAKPCVTYWHKTLLPTGETFVNTNDVLTDDITPDIGIVGTPVIDSSTGTLYVVTKSEDTGTGCAPSAACHQRLHALSLIDGSEKFGGPVDITAAITVAGTGDGSTAGSVPFNPLKENQRPGLALVGGVVYVAWASHGDNDPYHGWVIGFSSSTLAQVPNAVFNSTPNLVSGFSQSRGGIWMAGGAPAADAGGNLYFLTGNGSFDADSGGSNYGDSTVKLSTAAGLSVVDWFTPTDQLNLNGNDSDHGSGGAAILVDPSAGPIPHLLIGGGKAGTLFLLNRDNLGHFNSTSNNQVVQSLSFGNPIFATAAFWNNTLYLAGSGGPLKSFTFNTSGPNVGKFNATSAFQSSASYGFPGSTPSISSSGNTNGIVWAIDGSNYGPPHPTSGPAIVHAYDATNVGTELWNSTQGTGNAAGNAVKFTVPTIANGKVYVGTRTELDVYGLLPN